MKKRTFLLLIGAFSLLFHTTRTDSPTDPGLAHYVHPAEISASSFALSLSDEPEYANQTHLQHLNIGQTWDTYRGKGVTVAVIDSGINTSHVDFLLNGQTTISPNSAHVEEKNLTGTGYSNVVIQSVKDYGLSVLEDTNGHGTNVAGTLAAAINGVGTAGVAPEVNLLILKTSYQFTEINKAIRYAVDQGADIINMSFTAYVNSVTYNGVTQQGSGSIASSYFQSQLNYAYNHGVTLVAAAGNHHTSEKAYPAANNHVISVGALANNSSTSIASYSNYTLDNVDVVAPGTVYVPDIGSPTSYTKTQGTSFAAPIVSGVLALYQEKNANSTPDQQEAALKNTVYDLGETGPDDIFGYGRVDVERLMSSYTPVTGISISPTSLQLQIGETKTLTAKIMPEDATNQDYLFISDDDTIATVDEISGLVTAIAPGTTRIGVLSDDGSYEAYCDVTVQSDSPIISVTSVSFEEKEVYLKEGITYDTKVTVLPENAENQAVTYQSNHPEIVSVDQQGKLTAIKEGTATIEVQSVDNAEAKDTMTVHVQASTSEGTKVYQRVTEAPTDWSGEYLIVDKTFTHAMNGSLTTLDAVKNYISVTDDNMTIASDATTDASTFTIATMTGGYSIQSKSGKYIGNASNSNALTSSTSPLKNTLSIGSDGSTLIKSAGGAYLRFNKASDQLRFRYYKSGSYSSQQPIYLYKLVQSGSTYSKELQLLISDVSRANTCTDYIHAGDYRTRYLALVQEEKDIFDGTIIEDTGGSVTLKDKLAFMEKLYEQKNPSNVSLSPFERMNQKEEQILMGVVILLAISSFSIYCYVCKKRAYR